MSGEKATVLLDTVYMSHMFQHVVRQKHTWAKVDFLAPKQNQTKVKDLNLEQNEPNNFLAIKMEMNNNKKQQKNLLTKRYKSKIKQN